MTANYEHNNFSVSQCTWNKDATPHIVPILRSGQHSTHKSRGISTGAIVGIVIGVIVGLILLGCLVLALWKRNRRQQDQQQDSKPANVDPVELDSPEKDPYTMMNASMNKGALSPELAATEHKGHELPSPHSPQEPGTPALRYELDATERRSRTISTQLSFLSRKSGSRRMHERQMSDPVSLNSELSGSSGGSHLPELSSGMVSPIRQRSDATRLHKREMSDPVSLASGISDSSGGGQQQISASPISPVVQRSDSQITGKIDEEGPSQPPHPSRQSSRVTKLLGREPPDPAATAAETSQAVPKGHEHKTSDPISPTSETSDNGLGHKRDQSDPVSMLSDRPENRLSNI